MHTPSDLVERNSEGTAKASAYFAKLVKEGVAKIVVNEPKGDIFLDVTIEGVRFQAFAENDPYVTRKDNGDWCQLGVASIHFTNRWGTNNDREKWMVCKYSASEGRIDLSPLSEAGRRAFVVSFGIPIGYDYEYGFHEWYGFYASRAFSGLIDWAKRRPRKFKLEKGLSSYIGDWKAMVINHIDRETS